MESIKKWSAFITEEVIPAPVTTSGLAPLKDQIAPTATTPKFPISNYMDLPIKENNKYKKVDNGRFHIAFYPNGRVSIGDKQTVYVGNYSKSKANNTSATEEGFFKAMASKYYDVLDKDHFELETNNGYTISLYKNGQIVIDRNVMGAIYYQVSDMKPKKATPKNTETVPEPVTGHQEMSGKHEIDILKTANFFFKENFEGISFKDFFHKIKNYLSNNKPKDVEESKKLVSLLDKTKDKNWENIDNDGIELIKYFQKAKNLKKIDGIPGEETRAAYNSIPDTKKSAVTSAEKDDIDKNKNGKVKPAIVKITVVLPNLDKENNKGVVTTETKFFEEEEQKFVEATDDDYDKLGTLSNVVDDKEIEHLDGVKVFGDRGRQEINHRDITRHFAKHWWKATLKSDKYELTVYAREGQFLTRAFRDNEYTFQIDFKEVGSKTFAINHDIICKVTSITSNEVIDNVEKTLDNNANSSKLWSWDEFFLLK